MRLLRQKNKTATTDGTTHHTAKSHRSYFLRKNFLVGKLNNNLGYKLKPDFLDGSIPLHKFLLQFESIARSERYGWSDSTKTVALNCFDPTEQSA